MRKTKSALLHSAIALLLCISMLIGSTFAWFTDSVTSDKNIIQSGNLDIEMYWTDDLDSGNWYNVEEDAHNTIFSYDNWEPGYTDVKYIKLVNTGSLAMNYKLTLTPQGAVGKLAEVINVYFSNSEVELQERSDLSKLRAIGLLKGVLNGGATAEGTLLPAGEVGLHPAGEVVMTIAMSMITTAGNDYQNESSGEFTITALATQASYEQDSFGSDYDDDAEYPAELVADKATAAVTPVDGKVPAGGVTLTGANITAFVPAGAAMAPGADKLTLAVTPLEHTTSDIKVVNDEVLIPVDVHIEGLAEYNTVPAIISLGEVLPKYLNMGNYHLFHVEDGVNNEMTLVDSEAQLTQHNQYTYNSDTGEVTVAMATFSEVALVAEIDNAWEGNYDYNFNGTGTEDDPYIISKADELAGFGQLVGGMVESKEAKSYEGEFFKLISDINLGDKDGAGYLFHPIGYYYNANENDGKPYSTVNSFEGTFDGNGHTIANFYHNTWEIKGDYEGNYYNDAMGLFGYVVNGTVKNLTVDNFSSDGEFTPTGVIAAYAVNSTFENIAITNCNPRVYNTGNGGIVGIGGNSDDPDTYKLTFTNITIDNTNKITALWGSWDVACGGLVGMFRGAGHVYMTNCHVAAQMDVYNDVCGNYQYYWYRYSGMMVGTNKNMITDKDGYTVPETSKFHAEGCTVHFGNWNDYYYCELVANSLASYTHDHQFSRLEQISSLDEIKSGDTWTKVGNFLLIDGDTKTCYHIVNKDGVLTQHTHESAGYETSIDEDGDGNVDLKEDKQIVYLPFNQLFTGYGWGVKHIPVYNGEDYAFDGITILDRETADSEVKFEKADTAKDSYTTESTVAIGELFKEATLSDDKLAIVGDKVQVTVSPVGEDSTVTGTYVANTTDWTQGTLTFSGIGAATITITDYYFCTPTTIEVTITEPEKEVKFETKFNGDFLYRVGNADKSTVSLGTLFEALEPVTGTVDISIETVAGNASGIYTSNATWTNGTIQFTGTGVVKVTITDNDYCTPTELTLEVVDAVNATTATSATKNNVVLLNDVTNGSFSVGGGYAFYGNGFTITLNPSSHTTKRGAGFDGYVHMTGGILDNVRIEGPVFAAANIYRSQGETGSGSDDPVNYFRNAVIIDSGSNIISNSYIFGTRAAIYVKGGIEQVIENTTVSGGAYANIEVASSQAVTLRNLTTEQIAKKDSYSQNKDVVGIGVVVNNAETEIYIEGVLNQHNWITQAQWEAMLGDYVNQFPKLFTDSAYKNYWHYRQGDNSTKYVNLSVIFGCVWDSGKLHDNRSDTTTAYEKANVTVAGMAGGVYSVTGLGALTDAHMTAPAHTPSAQYPIAPETTFNHKLEGNYAPYTEGNNVFCYEESGVVKISFNEGESKNWNTSILTVSKLGNSISYMVKMGNTEYTGKSITFSKNGEYAVTYTYTDPYNYKLVNGEVISYSKEYTETVNITVTVVEEQAKNAEFTMGTENKPVDKIIINNAVYLSAQGVDASTLTNTHTDGMKYSGKTTGSWASKTINGHTFYMPVVAMTTTDGTFEHTGNWYGCFPVFDGAITITDFVDGVETVYNSNTTTLPDTMSALDPQNTFVYQGTVSKVPTSPSVPTNGGSKGKLCYTTQTDLSASNERGEMWTIATYTFEDNKGTTYYWYVAYYCAASTNGGCVTGDTLVTLADGTQKRIDQLTYQDELLVWDFYNGCYTTSTPSVIYNHGDGIHTVTNLHFSDGSTVKIINEHEFFDAGANSFVYISQDNVAGYIGHKFIKANGNGYKTVILKSYSYTQEETGMYTILTAKYNNAIVEGMLSLTPDPTNKCEDFFRLYEVDENMKYDEVKMQANIEKYGLFTYEDLAAYVTYEEFVAFNGEFYKILVGKGLITVEDIVIALATYAPNH